MPIDPSIILSGRPAPIVDPFTALSHVAHVREQRDLAEARRLAAEEARSKAKQRAQVAQAYQQSVTLDPKTGRPTVDYGKLFSLVPAEVMPDILAELHSEEATRLDVDTKTLALGAARQRYLGDRAPAVVTAKGDPQVWAEVVRRAHADRAIDDQTAAEWSQLQDPQAILARAQSFAPGGEAQRGVVVGAGQRIIDPVSGRLIAEGPPPEPKAPESFTLSPGQQRFGAGGAVVASVPPTPAAAGGADSFTLSPGQTRYGPGGQVIASVPGTAAGETPGAVKLSPAQQEDISTMLTVQDLGAAALQLGDEIKWAGVGPVAGPAGSFGARWFGTGGEKAEELRNLVGNIQGTIAKLRGGTAFSAQEKAMLESYTPTTKDSELQIKTKIRSLNNFITAKRENMLRVAGGQYTPREPTTAPPPPSHARTPHRVGDVVTVKGQKVRVTKLLPGGKYEGVAVP